MMQYVIITPVGITVEGTRMRKAIQRSPLFIGAFLLVVDSMMDIYGMWEATPTPAEPAQLFMMWLFAAATTAAMFFAEPLIAKLTGVKTAVKTDEIWREVDLSILDRWETVQHEFGIDPDEARAEITQFGHVLDQIELAETARQGASNEAIRALLDERVTILMRETLGPLAAELDYLKSEEGRIHTTVTDTFITITQQRQHEQDVAAELLACTPI